MITLQQIKNFLNPFKGATVSSNGRKGLVPAPKTNEVGEFYLNTNGTWKKIDQGWNAFPVGFIYDNWTSNTLLPNFLFLEGAEISRTVYADLYNFAVSNNMIITKTNWTTNKAFGLFHDGDGSTTFGLPDWRGLFKRISGNNAGLVGYQQNEGLPNITAKITYRPTGKAYGMVFYDDSGALYGDKSIISTAFNDGSGGTSANQNSTLNFNASRSNSIYGASTHVTPINIATRAIIKYK